jgi:hypothetical protein
MEETDMTISLASANKYIEAADIPVQRGVTTGAGDTLAASFQAAKDQATVVGGDVFSFIKGVTADGREAIVNSSLLAQLVAKKKVPNPDDVEQWYSVYFDALTNLGWVIQQKDFALYHQDSQNFEAHEAVLAVATTFLGGAPTALALVTSAIKALHSMDTSRPWITIFNRESQSARTGRFQIGLVSQETEDQFLVSMLAFGMQAKSTITQVLFFKARADEVTLRHDDSKVTIAAGVLTGALPALRTKLAGHISGFVSMADID